MNEENIQNLVKDINDAKWKLALTQRFIINAFLSLFTEIIETLRKLESRRLND